MSQETQESTSDSSTDVNPAQTEDHGESQADPRDAQIEELRANQDLMNDRFEELQSTIHQGFAQQNQVRQQSVVDPVDDEEGLTEGKVERIIQKQLQTQGAVQSDAAQRQIWDQKAKDEFPLTDPKFERAFRQEWKEQMANGLTATHPKAVYNIAKLTARHIGIGKKKKTQTADTEAADTGEATQPARSSRSTSQDKYVPSTDDKIRQSVAFYNMKGNKTKEQLAAFQQKLEDKSGRKARRA